MPEQSRRETSRTTGPALLGHVNAGVAFKRILKALQQRHVITASRDHAAAEIEDTLGVLGRAGRRAPPFSGSLGGRGDAFHGVLQDGIREVEWDTVAHAEITHADEEQVEAFDFGDLVDGVDGFLVLDLECQEDFLGGVLDVFPP